MSHRGVGVILLLSLGVGLVSAQEFEPDPEPEDMTPTSWTVPSYESYERELPVGIVERREVDLNKDGASDYVIFSSRGEETFLDLLLASTSGFLVWHMPVAEEYELLQSTDGMILKLKFATYPSYGSLWGPDVHAWYDHYRLVGFRLELHNQGYGELYRKQRRLYQERIEELEGLMATLESECRRQTQSNPSAEDSEEYREMCVWMNESRYTAQIEKYRKFIAKADELLNGTGA